MIIRYNERETRFDDGFISQKFLSCSGRYIGFIVTTASGNQISVDLGARRKGKRILVTELTTGTRLNCYEYNPTTFKEAEDNAIIIMREIIKIIEGR